MSIQDIYKNINRFLTDDVFFFTLLILLVAVVSFGLGRSSVDQIIAEKQPATVVTSQLEKIVEKPIVEDIQSLTETSGKYVASKNSDKYHLPWCSGAKRIAEANKIWFKDKEEAKAAGYTPAGNCKGI